MDNKQKSHDEQQHKKGIDKVAFSELNIISAYNNIKREKQLEWNVGFVSYLNFCWISTTISKGLLSGSSEIDAKNIQTACSIRSMIVQFFKKSIIIKNMINRKFHYWLNVSKHAMRIEPFLDLFENYELIFEDQD